MTQMTSASDQGSDDIGTADWTECGARCNQCDGTCDRPADHTPSVVPHRCNSEPLHTWR